MFSDVQSALIALLESRRSAVPATTGRLAPSAVLPYGGQLLEPSKLVLNTPVLYVHLEAGSLAPVNSLATVFGGDLVFDLICVAQNAASGQAQYTDGAALVTWTLEAMAGQSLTVAGSLLRWERFTLKPLLAHGPLWAAALSTTIEILNG